MGVPGADIGYVLESLKKIEDALCNQPCGHEGCMGFCIDPLVLLKGLQAELEAIR